MNEHEQHIPAERAYLAAQDLESAGRSAEALVAGIICGALGVVISGWVLVPMVLGHFLPVGAVVFLIVHGMVGGAFMGWLGGKLVWYRMDRESPPFVKMES